MHILRWKVANYMIGVLELGTSSYLFSALSRKHRALSFQCLLLQVYFIIGVVDDAELNECVSEDTDQ